MNYFNAILHDTAFQSALSKIHQLEETRIFCKHGINHLFDVARIAWIITLEHQRPFDKEVLYLAALLHDIGRSQTLRPHDEESVTIAQQLLEKHQVPVSRQADILEAIACHRQKSAEIDLATCTLGALLAYADERSRLCFACPASHDCYWPKERKNHFMYY